MCSCQFGYFVTPLCLKKKADKSNSQIKFLQFHKFGSIRGGRHNVFVINPHQNRKYGIYTTHGNILILVSDNNSDKALASHKAAVEVTSFINLTGINVSPSIIPAQSHSATKEIYHLVYWWCICLHFPKYSSF